MSQWPGLGDVKEDIQTPSLLLYEEILEENMQSYFRFARARGVSLRPHVKSHRIPELAQKQVKQAESGIMVQKLSLAETMVRHGLDDIVIVCPVVTQSKLDRLMWLAEQATISIVVDGYENTQALEEATEGHNQDINALIEVNVGADRTGSEPGQETAELGEYINSTELIKFSGVLAYDNHILYESSSQEEFCAMADEVLSKLKSTVDEIKRRDIEVPNVLAGTSGTSRQMCKESVVTEINPGRYLLNDASFIKHIDRVQKEDCAARILTTVISKPTSERVIIDAGAKTFSWMHHDQPVCVNDEELEYVDFSSEHGIIDTSDAQIDPCVGDQLEFIVGNIDATINLHSQAIGIRDGVVSSVWSIPTEGQCR
ncbi:alanine racemase [Halobellus marinus]|uniref:alanine racemase n=1 Tax=Halobellus sp. GCM10025813 TaxID=3252665 RepID=UPI003614797A